MSGALDQALKLLNRKALSRAELEKLLTSSREYSPEEVQSAIEKCCKIGFLNDRLMAEDYAKTLEERNISNRLMRRKLAERKLSEYADQAISELFSTELERAQNALAFKLRLLAREKDPRKKREKALRFLLSRGFSLSVAAEAYRTALNAAEDTAEYDADDIINDNI